MVTRLSPVLMTRSSSRRTASASEGAMMSRSVMPRTARAKPDDLGEYPVPAEVPGLPVLPIDGVGQLIKDQPKGITARRHSGFLGRRRDPLVGVDRGSRHLARLRNQRFH